MGREGRERSTTARTLLAVQGVGVHALLVRGAAGLQALREGAGRLGDKVQDGTAHLGGPEEKLDQGVQEAQIAAVAEAPDGPASTGGQKFQQTNKQTSRVVVRGVVRGEALGESTKRGAREATWERQS